MNTDEIHLFTLHELQTTGVDDIRQGEEQIRVDGDSKLNDSETLSKKIMSESSSSSQKMVLHEVERCKSDWSSLVSDIGQVCVIAMYARSCSSLDLTQC